MVEFSLDADSGRVVVKIIDSATQEVVRQIPMEEMLALAKALDQFQGSAFADESLALRRNPPSHGEFLRKMLSNNADTPQGRKC